MDISLSPDGKVFALHSDEFSLSELGNREIVRLTDIAFDTPSQSFTVLQVGSQLTISKGHSKYADAVAAEKRWFSRCLDRGVDPRSPSAVAV